MPTGNNTYLLALYNTYGNANIYWLGICQVWNGNIITLNEISRNNIDTSLNPTHKGLTINGGIKINHAIGIKIGYYSN